uniref:Retrotransposon protein n=1 Tax=Cucumis melo TaxID=3656 RepID=A0A9I9DST2_CUCME
MKCLMNKPFPYYDKLSYLFGKDRAMGGRMETFVDVGSNDASGYKRFPPKDGINMDIPTMYNQEFNMSPEDIRAP